MVDTARSTAALQTLLADNSGGAISEQDVRDMLVSLQPKIDGLYILDDRNYPHTRTGVTDAIVAANAAGGGLVLIPPDTTITSDGTAIEMLDNVGLQGCGRTSVIQAPASATSVNLLSFGGGHTGTRPLNGNEDEGDRQITLTAGSVAALSLVVGDFIYLYSTVANHNLVTRVDAIAGELLTLADPLPAGFTSAASTVVNINAPIQKAAVRNLRLYGNTNSGTTRGITVDYSRFLDFEDLWFDDFPEAAFITNESYSINCRNFEIRDSGSANESDFHMRYSTNCSLNNLKSYRSGFGPQLQSCTYCRVSDVFSTSSSARAFKLQASIGNTFHNVHALNSADTYTGFSITQVSHRNHVYGLFSQSNGHAGLWFEGGCNYNRVIGGQSRFNTTRDVEIGAAATSNVLLYVDYSTILDGGTTTVLVP